MKCNLKRICYFRLVRLARSVSSRRYHLCADSSIGTTATSQNVAAVPDRSPDRCRTSGPGPGRTIGATNCSSYWRFWAVRSV